MKKGFTLIELLAVIVILAILLLIAIPIIQNIQNDSQKKTVKISAENYLHSVNLALANVQMKDSNQNVDGTYTISEEGKVITRTDGLKVKVGFDGEGLTEGTLVIKNGKITKLSDAKINDWYAKFVLGRVVVSEELYNNTLMTGKNFIAAIKTLAKGSTVAYNTSDTLITSIEFCAYGTIPEKYTKEEFQELAEAASVDVSLNQDGTILAIYDGEGTIYIYSEDYILGNSDSSNMFYSLSKLNEINLNDLDISEVTNMDSMFAVCANLTDLDIGSWDTSNVTDMSSMFAGCSSLTSLNIGSWDTSNVTSMYGMFSSCRSLTNLNIGNWDTSSVTIMNYMFSRSGLTSLDLSGWDTSSVTEMHHMFSRSSLTSLNIGNWDTSSLKNMYVMFYGCSSLTSLNIGSWDTSNITNMSEMFYGCSSLTSLDLSGWDTSSVINTEYMFKGCSSLTSLNISSWDTSSVTRMFSMFSGCSSLTSLDLSGWDTSSATSMGYMFYECSNLTCIKVGDKWKLASSRSYMYTLCGTNTTTTSDCPVTGT